MLMRFIDCKRIAMRDVSLINPAGWTTAWLYCDEIVIEGIRIHSRVNSNGDGLDFDGCTNVRVSDCSFDNSDDSICLQASRTDRPCKDILVTNCIFSTRWAGMRIGVLSLGDIERVAVSNCVFRNISDSGLKIQMCEGGIMQMPPEAEAPPHWLPYVAVEDVDATTKRVSELGGQVYREPGDIPDVGRFSVCADPTGAPFALFKPAG